MISDMDSEDEVLLEVFETAQINRRQHAPYFTWLPDRSVEELGVVQELQKSLERRNLAFFRSPVSRGKNDPPDCEAMSLSLEGEKIAIEVTELVESKSIAAYKHDRPIPWEPWSKCELHDLLRARIEKKDRPTHIEGGPYDQYVLVIYCDEPQILDFDLIEYMRHCEFGPTTLIDRAFFLMSYDPREQCCPFIELTLAPRTTRTEGYRG
jgi:hypothetical protein